MIRTHGGISGKTALVAFSLALLLSGGYAMGRPVSIGDDLPPAYIVGTPGADPIFSFSFTDGGGFHGSGLLDATDLGGGQFGVVSATGTFYSPDSGELPFSVDLLPIPPSGYGFSLSPSGAFIVDNFVFDPADPAEILDNDGLLFKPTNPSPFTEINIFGNDVANGYSYYDWNPNSGFGDISNSVTFTLAPVPVPLPASAGLGFAMLLGFGGLFAVRKQLSRRSRIA